MTREEYNAARRERYHSDPDYRARRLVRDYEVYNLKRRHRYATDAAFRAKAIDRSARNYGREA